MGGYMRLKNKKTGEIVYATMMASYGGGELQIRYYPVNNAESTHFKEYRSISELNEEWEDYEEPKEWWFIDCTGSTKHGDGLFTDKSYIKGIQEIGNYFETKEEAEQAVEKLKAYRRLKDKGFRFTNWNKRYCDEINFRLDTTEDMSEDLDLLFGGEE